MALCSLSTGRILTPHLVANSIIRLPPATKVSLLASAISLPDKIASYVGAIPLMPIRAFNTISASILTISRRPSSPIYTSSAGKAALTCAADSSFPTHTASGLNSLTCFISSCILFLHVSAATLNLSGFSLTISKA